jgi:hypothetical protein
MKAMSFSGIDRDNLYAAREVLQKLHKVLLELETKNARPQGDQERKELIQLREKLWYLSSRFYEYIPHEEFRNKLVPPIQTLQLWERKSDIISSLIDSEIASQIFLAAHNDAAEFNPIEYCYKAIGVKMSVLEKEDPELKVLRDYCLNTIVRGNQAGGVRVGTILKVQEKEERELGENRLLLFNGQKTTSYMGVLK